jgi:hypothetical protein
MNSEALRIATELRDAFAGNPWHGSPLSELLEDVDAAQASARPVASAHTIHELVLHIDIWLRAALDATNGIPMPGLGGTEKDWPAAIDDAPSTWAATMACLFEGAEQLAPAIAGFSDERLRDIVPGREYDFYYLFHGIVQHSLYHGGQIAILKKAAK